MVVAESRGLLHPIKEGDRLAGVRESIMIRQLERELSAKGAEMRFMCESMAAQYVPGDGEREIFRHHRDAANKNYLEWLSHTRPYEDWAEALAEYEQAELERDVKTWETEFGSLEDPEVQEENARLADWLRHGHIDLDDEDREM